MNRRRSTDFGNSQAADRDSSAHQQLQLFRPPPEEKDDFACGCGSSSSGAGERTHECSPSSPSSSPARGDANVKVACFASRVARPHDNRQAEVELREEREHEVVAPTRIRNELDPVNRERAFDDLGIDVAGWLAAYEKDSE